MLFPLDYFSSLMGQNHSWSVLLGIALGTLITLWTIAWIRVTILNMAYEVQVLLVHSNTVALWLWRAAIWAWNAATTVAIAVNIWWNREVETTRLLLIGAAILQPHGQPHRIYGLVLL